MDLLSKIFEPVTIPIHIKDMRFMEEPVQDSGCGYLIGVKDMHPVFNRPVRGDNGAALHITS